MKTCKIDGCFSPCYCKTRYCHKHYLQRKAEQRKARKDAGKQVRTLYNKTCVRCGATYTHTRKSAENFLCANCKKSFYKNIGVNEYEYSKGDYKTCIWKHRVLAEQVIGRKLNTNEVVHHIDGNPKNNELSNLIVLSRSKHVSLHHYLNKQRVIIEGSINENLANCWDNLILSMTTTWLETTNVKVIKLWEVSQSAAKPLNDMSHGEGSETIHQTTRTVDDIVQTTTEQSGLGD